VTGMDDRLRVMGLRAFGRHGVLPHEREVAAPFVVDAVLELDLGPAAAEDELSMTVNYATLARALAAVVEGPPVRLLETLAERLAAVCLAAGRVQAVEVTVHKPHAPVEVAVDDVSVTVRRLAGVLQ
jgi:dihydroneopterin aldolase